MWEGGERGRESKSYTHVPIGNMEVHTGVLDAHSEFPKLTVTVIEYWASSYTVLKWIEHKSADYYKILEKANTNNEKH